MDTFLTLTPQPANIPGEAFRADQPALVVLWSLAEPERVGELVLPPQDGNDRLYVLGRGDSLVPEGQRLELFRQRPGSLLGTGSLRAPMLSRVQLGIRVLGRDRLQVENRGKLPLKVHEQVVNQAELRPGDLLEVSGQLLLRFILRPLMLPVQPRDLPAPLHPFGEPDQAGLVGESPASWELRRLISFVAPRQTHVLLLGASGTGKELVARAIHQQSARSALPLVSRNAATLPESLIDAELFGHARNYPNPGMPERPGLVGQAHGSTLFLDEIGELPHALQAHLLRVLDQGEYQRLGEALSRAADLRLVGATNRPESSLKHDLLARFGARISLPDLNARPEDIPLITRHLLRRIASQDKEIRDRFFERREDKDHPRLSCALVAAMQRQPWTTHVRELEAALWQSMLSSPGGVLELTPAVLRTLQGAGGTEVGAGDKPSSGEVGRPPVDLRQITPELVQAALEKHRGHQEKVCQELGLPNRFVLYRLIKKYGLRGAGSTEG